MWAIKKLAGVKEFFVCVWFIYETAYHYGRFVNVLRVPLLCILCRPHVISPKQTQARPNEPIIKWRNEFTSSYWKKYFQWKNTDSYKLLWIFYQNNNTCNNIAKIWTHTMTLTIWTLQRRSLVSFGFFWMKLSSLCRHKGTIRQITRSCFLTFKNQSVSHNEH